MSSDRPFTKDCNTCGQNIGFRKEGGRTLPINEDGTPHRCRQAAPAAEPKEDSRIGIYGGISLRRINLTLKNGSIMVTEATPDLLKCLTDPASAVKTGMKIKVIFAKDGKAEKTEICPDQPAPAAAPAPVTTEQPKETSTSPNGSVPPFQAPAERKKGPVDEIRQQVEFKNWTEAINSAITYHQQCCDGLSTEEDLKVVFSTAKAIHKFISEQVGGA